MPGAHVTELLAHPEVDASALAMLDELLQYMAELFCSLVFIVSKSEAEGTCQPLGQIP